MNGNGKIIARVTLASESVPVKDAIVTASTNVDDKQILYREYELYKHYNLLLEEKH